MTFIGYFMSFSVSYVFEIQPMSHPNSPPLFRPATRHVPSGPMTAATTTDDTAQGPANELPMASRAFLFSDHFLDTPYTPTSDQDLLSHL